MEWNKLVSNVRVPATKKDQYASLEMTFDSDYRRIVKSSSFRRLQDKTQVYPLDRSDFVRTRLTHSLEVAMLSKDLLNEVIRLLEEKEIDTKYLRESGRLLESASLIHDIGNPPFGHFGEEAIRLWFERNEENFPEFKALSPALKNDFLYFEGNAQTIRVLCKLHDYNGSSSFGMRLSASVLDSVIKYTALSTEISKDKIQNKKLGCYYSEKEVFTQIKEATGTKGKRHPLVYLLEASDDISYTFSDLEDGYNFEMFHYSDLREYLKSYMTESEIQEVLPADSYVSEEALFQKFLRNLQHKTYLKASQAFVNHYEEIMAGSFNEDLFEDESIHEFQIFNALKKFCFLYIFEDQRIIDQELIGFHIIESLLDRFVPVVLKYDTDPSDVYKNMDLFDKKIFRTFFLNSIDLYENETKNASEEEKVYYRLKMAVDYVCGMTDNYARTVYKSMFEV